MSRQVELTHYQDRTGRSLLCPILFSMGFLPYMCPLGAPFLRSSSTFMIGASSSSSTAISTTSTSSSTGGASVWHRELRRLAFPPFMEGHVNMGVRWRILGALLFCGLCLGCFLVFFFDLEMSSSISQSLGLFGAGVVAPSAPRAAPGHVEFSLLIGVLTRATDYADRHFLRLVYRTQPTLFVEIDVKFVVCNLTNVEQKVLVGLEILRYGDIIVLNCTENMDNGKTYTYFSSLPRILPRRYDYIMKTDTDTYLRLGHLAESLRPLPREDLYYGFVIPPCRSRDAHRGYMSGMGYVLSWDLAEWIGVSEIPPKNVVGPEDRLVGQWLDAGNKARNRYTEKPGMYDYLGADKGCPQALIPETVAVHRLKTQVMWIDVLNYFNATRALKPSNLYHIV
ncbi:hypothetical protein Taro_044196 [Colocasia esculenta]|uniref:Hexosyltransferase n=1 Tax=Colocasia esculenta TaxID=4460 RepID=A0A843WN35_COLES|nr:hypothetical protein [Colocasia esculenta]